MGNQFRGRPIEELKQIRATHSHDRAIWQLVDDEIHRQESEAAKKDSEAAAKVVAEEKRTDHEAEERRFQAQFDETCRQNWWTRWIALASLLVSVIALLRSGCLGQSASQASGNSQPVLQPLSHTGAHSTAVGKATP